MNKILILLSSVLLVGCMSKPSTIQPASKISSEVLGTWKDDGGGCSMLIELHADNLVLTNFTNASGVNYHNVNLQWSKQSVFTVFSSTESSTPFIGRFNDGLITIDNGLCNKILKKINTK
jgi:hypothetical protein